MTEKTSEANRRRKWAPKARTGCRTCKTRHVKCDEKKPVCMRCALSGFRCDGYPTIPTKAGRESPTGDRSCVPRASSVSDSLCSSSQTTAISDSTASSANSPTALTPPSPSLLHPTDPYLEYEHHSRDFFIRQTAPMVGRSSSGPYFWQTLVPQAAWVYPSVRHAMLATSIRCEALLRRDGSSLDHSTFMDASLRHMSKAIHALIHHNLPLDITLLTSTTLGLSALYNGKWNETCTHVLSSARLAPHLRPETDDSSYISFYCQAFASALPGVLRRSGRSDYDDAKCPPKLEEIVRLTEAIRSLEVAARSFEQVIPRLLEYHGEYRTRMLKVISYAKTEVEWLSYHWTGLLHEELQREDLPDDEIPVNFHQIDSPWSACMLDLNNHLDRGGKFEIKKFEIAMERMLPFYMFAKSGPNIRMREVAVQLMHIGIGIRGKTISVSRCGIVPSHAVREEVYGT